MHRRRLGAGLGLLVFLLVVPAVASATVVKLLSVRELVERADTVVVGTPLAAESFWDEGRIFTRVKVAVADVWHGTTAKKGATIDVLTLGGVVGDLGQRVDGAAVLPIGRRLVLFLMQHPDGSFRPRGMWQGVFLVKDDGAVAPADPEVDRDGDAAVTPEARAALQVPRTLFELKRAVDLSRGTKP